MATRMANRRAISPNRRVGFQLGAIFWAQQTAVLEAGARTAAPGGIARNPAKTFSKIFRGTPLNVRPLRAG